MRRSESKSYIHTYSQKHELRYLKGIRGSNRKGGIAIILNHVARQTYNNLGTTAGGGGWLWWGLVHVDRSEPLSKTHAGSGINQNILMSLTTYDVRVLLYTDCLHGFPVEKITLL